MFKWEISAEGPWGSALCAFVICLEGDFMGETVISCILVLWLLSIYVYIRKESTNSESILSVTFHCCYLYRVLVSITVSKSQNFIPVPVVPQGRKNLLQLLKKTFSSLCRWLKYTMGMAMISQLLLPSLNCKTYDCSIKISCKFFSLWWIFIIKCFINSAWT